jgi:hypothetical protein
MSDDLFFFNVVNDNHIQLKKFDIVIFVAVFMFFANIFVCFLIKGDDTASYP